jgi:hypothetical protein
MKRVGMKTKNGQVFLNANEFANGAYILRIVDGNASTSQRWVVQH